MTAGRVLLWLSTGAILVLFYSCNVAPPSSPHSPSIQSESDLPELQLFGAYPNSFGAQTSLAYEIRNTSATSVQCIVYNSAGERVQRYTMPSNDSADVAAFHSRELPYAVGFSTCTWDGSSINGQVPNGVYYVEIRLTKDDANVSQRTLVMRKR